MSRDCRSRGRAVGLRVACLLLLLAFAAGARTGPAPVAGHAPARRSLIVNGDAVPVKDYPYYVSVRIPDPDNEQRSAHVCGGSLVAPNIVLTAAHCVYDDGELRPAEDHTVSVGSNSYFAADPEAELIEVVEVLAHPQYQPIIDPLMKVYAAYENDIALLVLANATQKGEVVVLANEQSDAVPGDKAQVVGWGNTIQAKTDIQRTSSAPRNLQHAEMTIISNARCDSFWRFLQESMASNTKKRLIQLGMRIALAYGDDEAFTEYILKKAEGPIQEYVEELDEAVHNAQVKHNIGMTHICAEDISPTTMTGVCSGDSGGPLFITNAEGQHVQVGVASFVESCGTGFPDTYARVSAAHNFIMDAIAKHSDNDDVAATNDDDKE